ncbi:hypothetical protein [Kineococcus radiotolerans]|uniref:Uncharacterized protein n=1 Tax=Kineococcus radiotolerans (strain ATCC BAA-149 / DSM 14245 / SRS30216) TaxID=266940 RepID=A6WGX0_KINRD|nr:hypothetical protein [Kineococcus radiotolerans]ABS06059.1 hypothetical protein Krad_4600 [Kineococcus radiotolerans SRS30216 = ATCC BAA-149]
MSNLLAHLPLGPQSIGEDPPQDGEAIDRRSLPYRLNQALNTFQIGCLRGAEGSPEPHRLIHASFIAYLARQLGATITGEELHEIREGRQLEADPRQLQLVADVLCVPGWVLTETPPPGRRVVLAAGSGDWRATLVSDDGGARLSTAAVRELTQWIRSLPKEEVSNSLLPVVLQRLSQGPGVEGPSSDKQAPESPQAFFDDVVRLVQAHAPRALADDHSAVDESAAHPLP